MNRNLRNLLVLISMSCCVFSINAQVSEKLQPGGSIKIIGSERSIDYSNNQSSTTVNTKAEVFDGNFNTFFASFDRSKTWVGLDLGEKCIITKVAYAPRINENARLLLGVFEGANKADFSDAIPILMVTETPQANVMTEQEVNCSRGFRYVRYIGPHDKRCNIAELAFYGYRSTGNDTHLPQLTNLPTVSIKTKDAQDITSKETYLQGTVSFIYDDGTSFYTDNLDIRGRGNASWSFNKKPYRMKLAKKVNLMGFPARERNWTLISNEGDKTLMRNLLAFDISRRLELSYTPVGRPVDVFLNGEYQGTYQLCDHIQVAPGRVEVEEMGTNDNSFPNLSGGYLIEVDAYASPETEVSWFTSKRNGTPVTIKYPDEEDITTFQTDYIKEHYYQMELALASDNFRDQEEGYRKYIDVPSFIRHFIVGELSGNTDTYWSVYMYKNRNDDRFRFGPVWDFDIAFENDIRTYPINNKSEWVYQFGSRANGFDRVVNRLMEDNYFTEQLKATYAYYRDEGILTKQKLLQLADDYAAEINESQKLNFMRWDILNSWVHMNPQVAGSYQGEVDRMKDYISARFNWMDKKLNYVSKEPPGPNDNLAINKPIESSSEETDVDPASKTVDGDMDSRWESKHGEDNKELIIDLQKVFKLTGIVLFWETAYASEFNIEVSTDKIDWTTVQNTTSGNSGEQRISVDNVDARYVRINCIKRATEWGFSLFEVEVFGTTETPEPPEPPTNLSVNTYQEIVIFPNPVKDILSIQSDKAISGLILSDLNGRKLLELNGDTNSIDMSTYSTGMYLLTIKTSDGETVMKKVIKQ